MPIARYLQLDGGMNTAVNHFLMQSSEFEILKNCDISTVGQIEKGLGHSKVGNVSVGANPILGLVDYGQSNGTREQFCVLTDDFYKNVAGVWTLYGSNNFPAQTKVEFEIFLDSLFAVNGVDANLVLSGGTWSTTKYLRNCPVSALIKQWHERLFVCQGSKVWFSDVKSLVQIGRAHV